MRKTFTCCFLLFSYLSIAQICSDSKAFNHPASPDSFSTLLMVVDGVLLDTDKPAVQQSAISAVQQRSSKSAD